MDFDASKENIQPLAGGRNIRFLEAALNASTSQELHKQRRELEEAIRNYDGEDPLEPWFEYILWIEQSYPSGGKESGLDTVLLKCLSTFENESRYNQDRRLIKLYIKYIDSQPNPPEFYQELYNQGIGTMVADLYICWAYYYELCGNLKKADAIFRKGIDARAQPFDELDQAHKHFGFMVSQRILYQDEMDERDLMTCLKERRFALTSLRHHKKKVGSIRTGAAIKSENPGRIQIDASRTESKNANKKIDVFQDQNNDPNFQAVASGPSVGVGNSTIMDPSEDGDHGLDTKPQSVVKSIIDNAREKENLREPGPWSEAKLHDKKRKCLFDKKSKQNSGNYSLAFEILEDNSDIKSESIIENNSSLSDYPRNYEKGIQLFPNHVSRNKPQNIWKIPVMLEDSISAGSIPMYPKNYLYPRRDLVFSLEELRGYRYLKVNKIENKFTKSMDSIWANEYSVGIRCYPHFPKRNIPQKVEKDCTERYLPDEAICSENSTSQFAFNVTEVYPEKTKEEFQFEEIFAQKWRNGKRKIKFDGNETILMPEDMDETVIIIDSKGRKSIIPSRRSLAIGAYRKSMAPEFAENVKKEENFSNQSISKRPTIFSNAVSNDDSRSKKERTSFKAKTHFETPSTNKTKIFSKVDDSLRSELVQSGDFTGDNEIPQDKSKDISKGAYRKDFSKINKKTISSVEESLISKEINSSRNFDGGEGNYEIYNELGSNSMSNEISIFSRIKNSSSSKCVEGNKKCTISAIFTEDDKDDINRSSITKIEGQTGLLSSGKNCNENRNETECAPQAKFEIFEDNTDIQDMQKSTEIKITEQENLNIKGKEKDEDVFKVPQPPRIKSQFQIYEDSEETFTRSKLSTEFAANETCSTQTFNLFIKAQLASTPIGHSKKNIRLSKDAVPCNLSFSGQTDQQKTPPSVAVNQLCSSISADCPQNDSPDSASTGTSTCSDEYNSPSDFVPNRQLSTIMEMTETNTGSSTGTSTISSAKTSNIDVINSPDKTESLLECPNKPSNFFRSEPSTAILLEPIQELSNENREDSQIEKSISVSTNYREIGNQATEKEDTFPTMLHSLKIFEDKTETIPKSSLFSKPRESDYFALFTKTPEKEAIKATVVKQQKNFQLDDSITLSKLDDFPLFKMNKNISKNGHGKEENQNENIFLHHSLNKQQHVKISETEQSMFPENHCKVTDCSTSITANQTNSTLLTTSACLKRFSNLTMNFDESLPTTSNVIMHTERNHKQNLQNETDLKFIQTKEKESSNDFNVPETDTTRGESFQQKRYSILKKFSEISKQQLSNSGENLLHLSGPKLENNATKIINNNEKHKKCSAPFGNELQNNRNDDNLTMENKTIKMCFSQKDIYVDDDDDEDDNDEGKQEDNERSIYYKKTPRPSFTRRHDWDVKDDENELYTEDLYQVATSSKGIASDEDVNPFSTALIRSFLEKIDIINYLQELPTCTFVQKLSPLRKHDLVRVNSRTIEVIKIIGDGAYGTVLSGKDPISGRMYALKEERPANLWEYYICLELKCRIKNPEIMLGFMDIEYGVIGTNASILISAYSKYGSLITVCNKVKKATGKTLDEYIVMLFTSQMLFLLDHLHGCSIIHADIKPDNFLLMDKLEYGSKKLALQLIDFGVSIDMDLFSPGQKFTYSHDKEDFRCIEMRENRPWTYQTDLYGLAGIIHVLLFGKYMDIENKMTRWTHKSKYPRYFNKNIWEEIFDSLLNIRNCDSMPNLQKLRTILEEELQEKERIVRSKIIDFNGAISS